MHMPKVSVIIPVFGVEKYIERCARSLFEQTLDDIEYLFINDCTEDASMDVLERVMQEYPQRKNQIRIVNMPTNSGQAAVRRYGIHLATGNYIIHCDSDDWVDIKMYEIMYREAVSEDLDIVICDCFYSTEKSNIYKNCYSTLDKCKLLHDLITQKVPVAVWNKLIKKELYNNKELIYPTHNVGEDYALTIQLVLYAKKYGYIKNALYYYYQNPLSITKQQSYSAIKKQYIDINDNMSIITQVLKRKNLYDIYNRDLIERKKQYRDLILTKMENDRSFRLIYLNSFPELGLNNEKGLIHKFKYLLIYFNMYPLFIILRKIVKRKLM